MVTAMSVSAGILQIRQQGRGLLWRQGKQRAIKEHILRPLLAAAQDEFGAADAFRGSGLINPRQRPDQSVGAARPRPAAAAPDREP